MKVSYIDSIIANISILILIFISSMHLFNSLIITLILSSTKFPKDGLKINYSNPPVACHTSISSYLYHLSFIFSINHSIAEIMLILIIIDFQDLKWFHLFTKYPDSMFKFSFLNLIFIISTI